MPPAAANKRALTSKEASLFKELLNLYETRQLKKGQKTADLILKKFPEHGETLCMKGLILTHMGKRDEGIELVKKGMRFDLTSHIVWHVFGLIQKGEKKYEEALKSYTQALRFDKDNMNIMRDAANLQAQLRIYDGLVETRHALLKLRPNVRQNWISLAVAHQLNGNLPEAKRVLEYYVATLKNVPDYDTEHSELVLYHVRLLEELGEHSEALSLLDSSARSRIILDRTAIMEYRARLLSKNGSVDAAQQAWRALIDRNPDYQAYYRGFLKTQDVDLDALTDDTRPRALEVLKELSEQLPRASTPRRLSLNVASGSEFADLAKAYISSALKKGIPSVFVDVKSLYADSRKQQVIEDLVEEMRAALATPSPSPPFASDEAPTTYLWTLYFLAQHYSSLSRPSRALELVDIALQHTPTLPELYTCKARILKRAGDPIGAANALNDARALDGQDRFLNTKCGKYLLRAGMVDEASDVLGLFTKKDATSPGADLQDMQSLLYLLEEGAAHARNGKWGLALKRYSAVQKVFNEYEEDQFDFHGYSIRKSNVNIYVELMSWEDRLRSHPAYVTAALAASRIYIQVHDDPAIATAGTAGALTDAEKKAKAKKAKKAQKVQEEAAKAASTSANEDKGLDVPTPKDDDPEGSKLLESSDPLGEASKWMTPLTSLHIKNLDLWTVVYDVAIRRQKYLQAAKALSFAQSLDADDAELHIRIADFKRRVSALPELPSEPVGSALTAALARLVPSDTSVEHFNSQYLQRHSASAKAVLAAAEVSRHLGSPREEFESSIFEVLNPEIALDVKTAKSALTSLQDLQSPRVEEFRKACDARFTLSTIFKSKEEVAELRKPALNGHAAETAEDLEKEETIG